jgi:hypothetical protein
LSALFSWLAGFRQGARYKGRKSLLFVNQGAPPWTRWGRWPQTPLVFDRTGETAIGPKTNKSFLLLFLKKEVLAYVLHTKKGGQLPAPLSKAS